MHRTQTHLRRVEAGPFAVHQRAQHRQVIFLHRLFTGQDDPCGAVGDLGAVAGGNQAEGAVEDRLQLGQLGRVRVAAHPVVVVVEFAAAVVEHLHLLHAAVVGGLRQALMAARRIGVHLLAADAEAVGQVLGGLAHVEADDGVSEAAQQADDGLEVFRPQLNDRPEFV